MNPDHSEQPTLSLPSPSLEMLPPGDSQPEKAQAVAALERQSEPAGQMPQLLPPVDPQLAARQASSAPTSPPSAITSKTPLVADDTGLIEKEWVEKAKSIVAHTKDDPRAQSQQINYLKADYLKRRYNKDLKVAEN